MGTLASEEEDVPINIEKTPKYDRGDEKLKTTQFNSDVITDVTNDYVAVFDPLDGSSNVDAGIPTGTIFGIFEGKHSFNDHVKQLKTLALADPTAECEIDFDNMGGISKECLVNTLQSGENLVAAGYCLYSSSVFFCLTIGSGVNIFTLDRSLGEFVLTYPNVKIPQRGKRN